jgi:hypothetical protein
MTKTKNVNANKTETEMTFDDLVEIVRKTYPQWTASEDLIVIDRNWYITREGIIRYSGSKLDDHNYLSVVLEVSDKATPGEQYQFIKLITKGFEFQQ